MGRNVVVFRNGVTAATIVVTTMTLAACGSRTRFDETKRVGLTNPPKRILVVQSTFGRDYFQTRLAQSLARCGVASDFLFPDEVSRPGGAPNLKTAVLARAKTFKADYVLEAKAMGSTWEAGGRPRSSSYGFTLTDLSNQAEVWSAVGSLTTRGGFSNSGNEGDLAEDLVTKLSTGGVLTQCPPPAPKTEAVK